MRQGQDREMVASSGTNNLLPLCFAGVPVDKHFQAHDAVSNSRDFLPPGTFEIGLPGRVLPPRSADP